MIFDFLYKPAWQKRLEWLEGENERSQSYGFRNAVERKANLDEIDKKIEALTQKSSDAWELLRLLSERRTTLVMLQSAEKIHEEGMYRNQIDELFALLNPTLL